MRLSLVCWVVLLLSASVVRADVYYMRASGSDKNDGRSPAKAVASLDRVSKLVKAGDTVYIGAGIYHGKVKFTPAGTADKPIRLIGDTAGTHTGDGGTVTLTFNNSSSIVEFEKSHFVEVVSVVFGTGSEGVVVNGAKNVTFRDSVFLDGREAAIELVNSASVRIESCVVGSRKRGLVVRSGSAAVQDSVFSGFQGEAMVLSNSGSSLEVRRSTISDSAQGVYAEDGTLTLVNVLIHQTKQEGVYTKNDTVLNMVHCTISKTGSDGLRYKGRTTLINNIFSDLHGYGIHAEGGVLTAQNNLVHNARSGASRNFGGPLLAGDPRFADAGARDYSLGGDSPAIDAGVDASKYTGVDRLGVSRPGGLGWDLGAYESRALIAVGLPYLNDFESGAGGEWSDPRTDHAPALTRFLGRHGRELASGAWRDSEIEIRVRTRPGEEHHIVFDLYVIDDWDGDHPTRGPDRFTLSAGGRVLMNETLTALGGGASFARGPDRTGDLGFGIWDDGVYRALAYSFIAEGETTTIRWRGATTEAIENESWGIDNVRIFHDDDAPLYLPVFADVSGASGFNLANASDAETGSGLLWADLDGDGRLDAVITGRGAILLNTPLGFTGVRLAEGRSWRQGALLDADRDGRADLVVSSHEAPDRLRLFLNDGSGGFRERDDEPFDRTRGVAALGAADLDGDGYTDLVAFTARGNLRFMNRVADGASVFVPDDEKQDALGGALGAAGAGFAASADVNDDGRTDFFHHADGGLLYRSGPDNMYTLSRRATAAHTGERFKAGAAWGDFDNDGDMDLFVPDRRPGVPGVLYENRGGDFVEVASMLGILDDSEQFSAAWGDFDNDGDLDLMIATAYGIVIYRNDGPAGFTLALNGPTIEGPVLDAVFVDFDNDGRLDIAATRGGSSNVLLRNTTAPERFLLVRGVQVSPEGVEIEAVGARFELLSPDGRLLGRREIGNARGLGGIEPLRAHFGGVEPDARYTLRVTWPGGVMSEHAVTPASASTAFGGVDVPGLVTVRRELRGSTRVVQWREVSPSDR